MRPFYEDSVKLSAAIAQWRRSSRGESEVALVQHFCRIAAEDAVAASDLAEREAVLRGAMDTARREVARERAKEARDNAARTAALAAEIDALRARLATAGVPEAAPTPADIKAARREGFAAGQLAAKRKYTNLR